MAQRIPEMGGNGVDYILMDRLEKLIENTVTSRSQLISSLMDSRQDIDDECGYPDTSSLTPKVFRDMFDRDPIASRVVEIMPRECWKTTPDIREDKDEEITTEFEKVFAGLAKNLRQESWFDGREGNPIWEHLKRADELSGIGSFGIVLLGFDDGSKLDAPAKRRKGTKLLYIRSFDESLVTIAKYETDIKNPRYGQPTLYNVTLNDPNDQTKGGIGLPISTVDVHWTRVVHLADNLLSSEVFGVPRCRPVYNNLYNLKKFFGASGEGYYKGAFPGLAIETHPSLGGDVIVDDAAMQDVMEKYMTGLQRYLRLTGMSAKSLAPQVVDPTPQIAINIEAICVKIEVPKRIFMGSERGELASTQDQGAWNDRVMTRQKNYVTPRVITPFIDRLIWAGVLPEPKQYYVDWPDLNVLSRQEQATVAKMEAEALSVYTQGGVQAVIPPLEFMVRFLGRTHEEAKAILDSSQKAMDGEYPIGSPLLGMGTGLSGIADLFRLAKERAVSEKTLKQLIMLFFRIDEKRADAVIADGLPEPDPILDGLVKPVIPGQSGQSGQPGKTPGVRGRPPKATAAKALEIKGKGAKKET